MNLKHYLQKAISLPPHLIIQKMIGKVQRKLKFLYQRQHDAWYSTHLTPDSFPGRKLHNYFQPVSIDSWNSRSNLLGSVTFYYVNHRFDLLGSGWVQVKHGMNCRGLENYRYEMGSSIELDSKDKWLERRINSANLAESQRIWHLVDETYTPIDWHLDFKSGYRWSENTWYLNIPYGHKLGVDIKVPWELTRMQHLPQLAWAYALSGTAQPGFAPSQTYAREFRNQVLDFIATNPPRFGVNWRCTMDVGIRVANWLVSYDLFRAYGAELDTEFETEFSRSIYQHGWHIIKNLEWFPHLRSNHYLANVVGLLFVAAYLPGTPTTNTWLAFAIQELIKEVQSQFYPDGANFEASTSYHRLSAEMVIYGTALVLGMPPEKYSALKEYDYRLHKVRPPLQPAPLALYPLAGSDRLIPFPDWYIERLEKMAEFTMHITKPNDHVPQIGDNDSGRFLKLQPMYHQMSVAQAKARYANLDGYTDLQDDAIYLDEDFLDHRHLVAAINGLFGRDDFAEFTGEGWLETDLIRHLAKGTRLASYLQPGQYPAGEEVRIGTKKDWQQFSAKLDSLPQTQAQSRQVLDIPIPGSDLDKDLKLYAYPNFGLYLYCSQRLYLAIRCGCIGQNGNGGHAHNDQLSMELNLNGEDWISDPGTYLYTPLPERRNEYRSSQAHFAPQLLREREQKYFSQGLFTLKNTPEGECVYFGSDGFMGTLRLKQEPTYHSLKIGKYSIDLVDTNPRDELSEQPRLLYCSQSESNKKTTTYFSNGYGKRTIGKNK